MENHLGRDILTVPVKYIYLDIVGFTQNRSIEAQAQIINTLNTIVREELRKTQIPEDHVIFLPTGDGICVALLNVEALYDVHMQVAFGILQRIHEYDCGTDDEMRRFHVRIGINANVDNLITDINGNRNVAGTGINFAQRVVSMADAGQILVGQPVYETLRHREQYMNSFRTYNALAKHNIWLPVFQYIGEDHVGLSKDEPSVFVKTDQRNDRLTKHVAFYFAHAIRNREFLMQQIDKPYGSYVTMILLWLLANDSTGYSEATEINPYRPRTWGAGKMSIAEQFEYYITQDVWLLVGLSKLIQDTHLHEHARFFDNDQGTWIYIFINHDGTKKLKNEWPGIWKDFEFEFYGS